MIVHSILLEEASDISALRRMCELCSDTRRLHGRICFLSNLVVLITRPLFCLGLRGRIFETARRCHLAFTFAVWRMLRNWLLVFEGGLRPSALAGAAAASCAYDSLRFLKRETPDSMSCSFLGFVGELRCRPIGILGFQGLALEPNPYWSSVS